MRIGIIGAGMAGLACAEALAAQGHVPVLLDKGRGPGGRMSTRRIATAAGEASFDHGAQYFTVRDAGFAARVKRWRAAGCVARWPAAGAEAFVGVPAMNAPLRAVAEAVGVQWGVEVKTLQRADGGWQVYSATALLAAVEAVVLAIPAEQAAALLDPVAPALAALGRKFPSAPCWTVMLAFAERLPTAQDCLRHATPADALGWAARNSAKPGRSGPESWVLQAGQDWSTRYFDAPADWVTQTLADALAARLGGVLPPPLASSSHRWRYARPGAEGSGAVWDAALGVGLCGDWLIGPRVEAAWLCGTMLAERIGA